MRRTFVIILLCLYTVSFLGIEVGGHISSDTIWSPADNPYIITSFLYVDAGVTLTILPGVQVQSIGAPLSDIYNFKWTNNREPRAKMIIVNGTINAVGTSDSPITFDKSQADPLYRWGGIHLNPGAPISTFKHCEFRNAFFCDFVPGDWSIGALDFDNGFINVRSCTFENNQCAMRTGFLQSDILLYDCRFIISRNDTMPAPFAGGPGFFGISAAPEPEPEQHYKVIVARCYFSGHSPIGLFGYYMDVLYLNNIIDNSVSLEDVEQRRVDLRRGSRSSYGNVQINGKGGLGCYTPTPADTAFARRNRLLKSADAPPLNTPITIAGRGYGISHVSDNYLSGTVSVHAPQANATTLLVYNNVVESCYPGETVLIENLGSTDHGGQVRIFNNLFRYTGDYQYPVCVVSRNTAPLIYNNHILNYHTLQSSLDANEVYTNNIIDCRRWTLGGISVEHHPLMINNCLYPYMALTGSWSSLVDGGGNIIAYPHFLDSLNDDYRISYESPCIDSGVNLPDLPDFDLQYHKRVVSGTGDGPQIVDIGAYEYGSVYIGGIQGYVYDAVTNLPVDCVKIEILGTLPEFSDTLGFFQYPTGAGTYTVKASRWDYQDMVIPGIETVLGEETLLSIPLVPDYVANDDQIQAPLAADFGLQNYPNPFNPSTTIAFIAPESGDVRLSIFNIKGQKVRDLHSGSMAKGHHTVTWDGLDDKGIAVSSGVFFVRIEMNGKSQAHKMVLMK